MEVARVYLLEEVTEEVFLTLFGLTHSAWWESSLKEGIGLSQNSQGSITVSAESELELVWTALERPREELTIEELVDLRQAKSDGQLSIRVYFSNLVIEEDLVEENLRLE